MILKIVNKSQLDKAIEFIKDDFYNCLYLYINLNNYNFNDTNTEAYIIVTNDTISTIIMKYYDTVHVYAKGVDCLNLETIDLLKNMDPKVIFVQQKFGKDIFDVFQNYEENIMGIYNYPKIGVYNPKVIIAEENDYKEIAEFLFKDITYKKTYSSTERLYAQLVSRYHTKQGEYYFLKENDRIVAVEGINAVFGNIVVIGSLLVDPEMRGKGLAKQMKLGLHFLLEGSNKHIFALINNPISESMTKQLGGFKVATISKFSKKIENT